MACDLHGPPLPHTERSPGGGWLGGKWAGQWVTLCDLRWVQVSGEWVTLADLAGVPMTFPPPCDAADDERIRLAEEKRARKNRA